MKKTLFSRTVPCTDAFGHETHASVTVYTDFTLRVTTPMSGADLTNDQADKLAEEIQAAVRKRSVARQLHFSRMESEAEIAVYGDEPEES
ncbi:hypothetical protein LWC34_38780 [Kibdelosporangium philippinense]|uniref:DUF1902 domain-containing protein n=1 Tax=Kibdelosporangium philippinense TaxID=211113 RepID=A0ABS8ZLN8_9PSEU|nr:hypothetical protein [Kibdelosporangium philippinense]MCE7008715.1 hypothetical protein [Kibdelosporangium philippinense]